MVTMTIYWSYKIEFAGNGSSNILTASISDMVAVGTVNKNDTMDMLTYGGNMVSIATIKRSGTKDMTAYDRNKYME